jgi:hypothetical protein
MTPEIQLLKYEIVAALEFLSLDSLKLLAKFVAFLRSNIAQAEVTQLQPIINVTPPPKNIHFTSPRLAHRHHIADFKKEMVELADDEI